MKGSRVMTPAEYLLRPYCRIVIPEADGTYRAEIMEFPGCLTTGATAPEALANLEEVAASWLEAAIAHRQSVPDPAEGTAFSGKLVLRLPRGLHRRAALYAARENVSLNTFVVACLGEGVGRAATIAIDSADASPEALPPEA